MLLASFWQRARSLEQQQQQRPCATRRDLLSIRARRSPGKCPWHCFHFRGTTFNGSRAKARARRWPGLLVSTAVVGISGRAVQCRKPTDTGTKICKCLPGAQNMVHELLSNRVSDAFETWGWVAVGGDRNPRGYPVSDYSL